MTMIDGGDVSNLGFRFREWDIYRDARIFRIDANKILHTYPSEEKYALVDQTKRALNSVVLNIAEGANRSTNKDRRIFIIRAHTSPDEVVAALDCAFDDRYITESQHRTILVGAASIAKRLRNFAKFLSHKLSL